MSKLGVGVLGCGNISKAYLTFVPLFKGIEVRAVADINPVAAEEKADEVAANQTGALHCHPYGASVAICHLRTHYC